MESQNEDEYIHSIWEIYRKEWETASPGKQLELNKRMLRWQEIRKSGLSAREAYLKVTQGGSDYRVKEEPLKKPLVVSHRQPRMSKISIILSLALVVTIAYGVYITVVGNPLNKEPGPVNSALTTTWSQLNSAKKLLAATQSELSSTKKALTTTQTELSSMNQTLATAKLELSSMNQTLATTQSELSSTNQTLASVQQNSANLQTTLSRTQQQLSIAQETLGGLGITLYTSKEFTDVDLIDNRTATNPKLSEVVDFILQDQTDMLPYSTSKLPYTTHAYDSSQHSRDVHNHAEAAGIKAAEVQVSFGGEESHALNAFLTTDYGLVYVDSSGTPDKIARVKRGKDFIEVDFRYGLPAVLIRRDDWWDNLSLTVPEDSIYYIPSSLSPSGKAVTSGIKIYW